MTSLLACIRFVHLASLSLLIGIAAFHLLVAGPALSRGRAFSAQERAELYRGLRRLTAWSLWGSLASLPAWLVVQAALMSGRHLGEAAAAQIVWPVLTRTAFGHVWLLRLALLGLLGPVLFRGGRARRDDGSTADHLAVALLGGGAMIALAWVGHAAATEGSARLPHLVADSVHLLATGVWLGGLLPLALFLRAALRPDVARRSAAAGEAVRRFSGLGLTCVASLLLTGMVNTWITVGSIPALVGTPYGRLLLLKLSLVVLTIGVAAQNRLRHVPGSIAPTRSSSSDTPLRQLRRNVLIETTLGGAILLIVGFLGVSPPALHVQPMWPFPVRLSETERWDLLNYLRMLPEAEEARSLGPRVGSDSWLVAPNFTFSVPDGTQETLEEQRDKAQVLLVLFTLPTSENRLSQLEAAREILRSAGLRVIAVPMGLDARGERRGAPSALPLVVDEAPEATTAYTVFARSGRTGSPSQRPSHLEFLIDRQGYIRGRWIPAQGSGWEELERLLAEVRRLAQEEPRRAPAPQPHVH